MLLECIFAHLRVGPEKEGSGVSTAIGQEINRERGGVQERSCSSLSSAMDGFWSSEKARYMKGQGGPWLGRGRGGSGGAC